MELITIKCRTQKESGKIKLRFRLREGRSVELYHKSDIEADISVLDKLTPEGTKKKGVTVISQNLLNAIAEEKEIMSSAYAKMKEEGLDLNSEIFEKTIEGIKLPVVELRRESPGVVRQFRQYADDAFRDGIIGKKRHDHIIVVCDKLYRFLVIKGMSKFSTAEFTESHLMMFRNFLFDEYQYVPKHPRLYKDMSSRNLPQARLSMNTVTSQMKMLQTFFSEMENLDEIGKSPFRKLGREKKKSVMKTLYDEPYFLRKEELIRILKKEVPPKLQSTKDAFLVHCALGCRVSDFQNMSMESIGVANGIPYVHYIPQKTAGQQSDNKEVETPIVRFAFDIIKTTNFDFPILRNLYGTDGYNARIKYLLSVCKINRPVPQYNEETRQNDYIPLHSVGSSKLARKTHVDMLNKVQIDLYASGLHKAGSTAVRRYTAMELKDRFALMNAAFDQSPYKVNKKLEVI